MIANEMDFIGQFRDAEPLPPSVADRAEVVLRAAIALDSDVGKPVQPPERVARSGKHRRHARRRRVLAATAGAVAAAAVTIAAATSFAAHRHPAVSVPTAPLTDGPGGIVTVSYVVERVSDALTATAGGIYYSQVHIYGAHNLLLSASESWIAPKVSALRDEQYNRAGTPVSGMVLTLTPAGTPDVYIDYPHHVWTARQDPPTGVVLGFGGFDATLHPGEDPATEASNALRAAASKGQLKVAGSSTVNGHHAIELQEVATADQPNTWGGGSNIISVDAQTYLPISEVITGPRDPQSGAQTYELTFQWLPPTETNMALFARAQAIPPGFNEVAADRYPGTLPSLAAPSGHQTQ